LHGTAIHDLHAAARAAYNPRLIVNRKLTVTLPSGLEIPGTPDEIDPDEPSVTDLKTVDDEGDLHVLRREGSSEQQRFQRHLYYLAAHQAGLVPAEGIVRNVWVDRAGQDDLPYVEQEPFSMAVVHDADRWITDTLYAAKHGEEVPRDKHYDWCRKFCEFFTHCRAGQAHADFVVTDPEVLQAARLLKLGRAQSKEGEALEKAAKRTLAPLQQSAEGDVAAFIAGDLRVRWSWVNSRNGGYWKVTVTDVEAGVAVA
jgi:hypothetical protein